MPAAQTPTAAAALLQQGTTAAAATAQQAATAPATQLGAAVVAAQQAAAAATTVTAQQGATPVAIVLEPGEQPVQVTLQPVTITAETPVTPSPGLVPQLAPEIATPQLSLAGAPVSVPTTALDINALSALIPPASPATDATALAVATSAALTLLQEQVQAGPLTGGNLSQFVFNNGAMLSLLPAVGGSPHRRAR